MPPPVIKASNPVKTMDITAFLTSGNRKRKASSSEVSKAETKVVKLSEEEKDHENDIEVLGESCGVKVVLGPLELDSNPEEFKENKTNNTTNVEPNPLDCKENTEKLSKDEPLHSVNNVPYVDISKPDIISDVDDKLSVKSNSSSDELNTSENVSLNSSMLSAAGEDKNDDDKSISDSKTTSPDSKTNECGDISNKKTPEDIKKKVKKKKMTPEEAKKKAEAKELRQKEIMLKKQEIENKKRERLLEKERKKREKELQKEREELERKERERLKQEKKEQEELERQQKLKEREEKLKIKQMMIEHKLEEKKRKEEIRLRKEEEFKKAEEEKLRLKLEKEQKEKEKKERAKAAFAKFFLKGNTNTVAAPVQPTEKEGAFLPFQVSDDMTLAPVVPPAAQERFNKDQLDQFLKFQDGKKLYLEVLKSGSYKDVRLRKRSKKLANSDADVIVIDQNAQAEIGLCPKLLQFCENVRPPYWGTWRKKSKNIGPRRPFGQDEIFDYEIDSDDEWDEGGPGESLSGTDQEDVESEDEYEVDNEFFVPHGYLSDEEEKKEDDDEEVNDPERQKALLKIKLQQFEMERKKKTTELKPIILGCYFANDSAFQDNGLRLFLETFSAELLTDSPIPTSFTVKNQQAELGESPKANSNSAKKKKYLPFPEEAFPHLILLVHGNTQNRRSLSEEFQRFWLKHAGETHGIKEESEKPCLNKEEDPPNESRNPEVTNEVPNDSFQISLRVMHQTIREIAAYGKSPDSNYNKYCWWVHDAIREKYGLMHAPIPNQWKYISEKKAETSP